MRRMPCLWAGAAVALAVTLVAACGDDDATMPETYAWAGTYAAQTRFGGCTGTWGSGRDGSHTLVVTASREVVRSGTMIVNPTVGDSSISWSMADGNGTNAEIQFSAASTNECNWGTGGATGPLFEGFIQFPGEGPLDYRGVQ